MCPKSGPNLRIIATATLTIGLIRVLARGLGRPKTPPRTPPEPPKGHPRGYCRTCFIESLNHPAGPLIRKATTRTPSGQPACRRHATELHLT